jgi:hypothetical protein
MEIVTKPRLKRRRCQWCREPFRPKGNGRPQLYCKPACRQRAYEKRKWQPLSMTDVMTLDLLPWGAQKRLTAQVRHEHMLELLHKGIVPLANPAQIDGILDAEKPRYRLNVLRRVEEACHKRKDDVALATIAQWRLQRQSR